MAVMVLKPKAGALQKFYVYDPGIHAGDEVGGLRVIEDEKNDKALHVLAARPMVQYLIDQGLAGTDPLSKLSGGGKKFLAQLTRGRSEDNDETPTRVPRYARAMQSGHPSFAATNTALGQRQKKQVRKDTKDKTPKKPATKPVPPAPSA